MGASCPPTCLVDDARPAPAAGIARLTFSVEQARGGGRPWAARHPRPVIAATLPIRALKDGKRRLESRLTPTQRSALIVTLVRAVVQTLRESGAVAVIGLISADDAALGLAEQLRIAPIHEARRGLNEALQTGAAWARAAGADGHLIILPDLPLLRPADIRAVIELGRDDPIVACPDRNGTGTNMLLMQPCGAMPPAFGPGSLPRHLAAAAAAGLGTALYDSPGTRWDIDTPADLSGLGVNYQ